MVTDFTASLNKSVFSPFLKTPINRKLTPFPISGVSQFPPPKQADSVLFVEVGAYPKTLDNLPLQHFIPIGESRREMTKNRNKRAQLIPFAQDEVKRLVRSHEH